MNVPRLIRKSLILMLALFLAVSASTQVEAQTNSGTLHLSASSAYYGSNVTLLYKYSSTISTGSDLVVTVTVHLDNVSGYTSYLQSLKLSIIVYIDLAHVLTGSVNSEPSRFLYPGASWGPVNVTMPVTEANSGVAGGQTRNANMSIALADVVWLARPLNTNLPQNYQGSGGYVSIYNPNSSLQNELAIFLLSVGFLIAAVAIVFPRLRKLRVVH